MPLPPRVNTLNAVPPVATKKKTSMKSANTSSCGKNDAEGIAADVGKRLLPAYRTKMGKMYQASAETVLNGPTLKRYAGKVQLVFSSPPYPLGQKKRYGNVDADKYSAWLSSYADSLTKLLKPSGSIVLEIGNAWVPGQPIMTTAVMEALLNFLKIGGLNLCQEFIWFNPARLPSPTQWVNVKRTRVKDAFTRIWWMSKTSNPKANNRNVLQPYSKSMLSLLAKQSYNHGKRPSEHNIGKSSFLTQHRGAIPPNVFVVPSRSDLADEIGNVLIAGNTKSNDVYRQFCLDRGIIIHPARMPEPIAEFFLRFLTSRGDMVLDPFAGSNTTGSVAEKLGRRWIAIEGNADYVQGSKGRFKRFQCHL